MTATPSAAERLKHALATLTASARTERVTITALCDAANVSRNSLYRYHPQVLRAVHEHQRQCGRGSARAVHRPEHAEVAALRKQAAKLIALADHYYAAYHEARALLTRREQELAELRRRLDSKPAILGR